MKNEINVKDIQNAQKYFFEADYIFPGLRTVDAFSKNNFQTGFHEQAFYEINIVTKGRGHHILDTQVFDAARGDVFVVPPHTRHAFVGGEGFDCFHFMVSPYYLQTHLSDLTKIPNFFALFEIGPIMSMHNGHYSRLTLSEGELNGLISTLSQIGQYADMTIERSLYNECLATMAIIQLCTAYSKTQKATSEDSFFAESINVIMQRYNEKLTIDELSAVARLSRTAYIERFKEVTGLSPRQFILRQRINVAKRLLASTEKSITKIAEEVGFFDTSHFVKTFIRICGMTPLEYRESTQRQSRAVKLYAPKM